MMAAYGMLFVGLTVLALCGGLLLLGLFAVRDVTRHLLPGGAGQGLEVLAERYTRGEITKEQYERTRFDLRV